MTFRLPRHYTEKKPLRVGGDWMFAIEGTIANLEIAETRVNLLEKLKGYSQATNAIAGVANAMSGMYGLAASSVMLANYDGETVYSFACLIDGKPVIGQFELADKLSNGDRVRVVVSKDDGVLFAHAVMDTESGNFMMPLGTTSAEGNLFKSTMMFGVYMWLFVMFMATAVGLFQYSDGAGSLKDLLVFLGFGAIIGAVILGVLQLWEYYTFKSDDNVDYGGSIFKVLGFPNSGKIDLLKHNCYAGGLEKWPMSYMGTVVLEKFG